jgi:tRNA threonylcarbamoyladenosine biosynthesis protein TsaE
MNSHTFDPGALGLSGPAPPAFLLVDEAATRRLGAAVGATSEPGSWVGLAGNLGAGKTTFTQGLCEAAGVGAATSPTYTLLNVYRGDPPVFHFDLYRLNSVGDLEGVGYWDYVESGEGITVVEWIDQIPDAWPGEGTIIELRYDGAARSARVWGASDELQKALDSFRD